MLKNVHPVYGAGIRTHNLHNMSRLPYTLDQGRNSTNKVLSSINLIVILKLW